ncbi:uncharacterized protein LOC119189000 [Manduca sexta]|uniref:uncharacterized protein LOC119189000 n=1 Tax=Manduca sexta TaxID=7130 RepID=UPI0018905FD2|nr:uncharacterized protein LOC119189000 [Manduca sexta]
MPEGNKDHNQVLDTNEQPENSKQPTETNKKSDKNQPEIKSIMTSGKSRTLKFAGPIKILVIETKGEYCKTIWCAIGIGLSHVMIGATNMAVLFYYLKSQDVHALTCTLGYHFFSAEAILSLNYANGWSTPMRLRHRRFVHVLLQLCAMVCAILGTTLVIVDKGASVTAHGITGIITVILTVTSFLAGSGALYGKKYLKITHISFGIPTFLMSSICFCTGLLTESFRNWSDPTITYLLLGFIIFYSIFIITTPFLKCMIRL